MKRVLLDTNVYVDWLNAGAHERVVVGPGLVRHMSAVVLMELEAGAMTLAARRAVTGIGAAFGKVGRLAPPSLAAWQAAGPALRKLRARGREVRRASLLNDLLIALTARDLGAVLLTRDESDFSAIRELVQFTFEVA